MHLIASTHVLDHHKWVSLEKYPIRGYRVAILDSARAMYSNILNLYIISLSADRPKPMSTEQSSASDFPARPVIGAAQNGV